MGQHPTALPKFAVPKAGAEALAVNDSGVVVGKATSPTSGTGEHAAAWANGVVTDLGTLKGTSVAYAVNNRGVIVGVSDTNSASANHAVLWSRIGAPIQDLNNLISAAAASEVFLQSASAINDNCTVVAQGFVKQTKLSQAFLLILNNPSQCVNGL
jgi:probable HAF family extracellular repeat protein